jgi:tetratricopeptide (TPR) repeat protein
MRDLFRRRDAAATPRTWTLTEPVYTAPVLTALVLALFVLLIPFATAGAQVSAQEPVQPPLAPRTPPTPDLLPVPHPDLEPLEDQVADQIREYQELTEETLDDPAPTAAERAGAFGEMGRIYHTYGLTAAAEACYVNAVTLAPREARWPYYLGLLRQQEGRFDTALEAFRISAELDPGYPPTFYRLAEVTLALGDTDEAAKHVDHYLELEPDAAAGWALKGEIDLSRKDYAAAVEHLERALKLLPRANRLHVPLALAYRQLGEMDKAREHLAQRGSIGARPDDPRIDQLEELKQGERVHIIRGRMAFQAGDLSAAIEEFRKAVDANPDSGPARVNLGSALGETGDIEGALEQYRHALELDAENFTAHYNLGTLLARRGDTETARKHLEEAVRLRPSDAPAQLELGRLLLRVGEPEEALRHFKESEANRLSEDARLGEAHALVALNRYREAKELLEETHRQVPESGRTARDLAFLLASAPDPELRDGERALDLAQRVFKARQTVGHAELLALALAELGRCQEAAQWQERALESAQHLGAEERVPRLAEALARYQEGPPCRPPVAASVDGDSDGDSGS